MIKCLLISAFAYFLVSATPSNDNQSCETLVAEVTTEDAGPSTGVGRIVIKYPDGARTGDYVLHLFAIYGETRRDLKTTEITGVKPGKYILIIVDSSSKYCPKKVDIEIKE